LGPHFPVGVDGFNLWHDSLFLKDRSCQGLARQRMEGMVPRALRRRRRLRYPAPDVSQHIHAAVPFFEANLPEDGREGLPVVGEGLPLIARTPPEGSVRRRTRSCFRG